MLESSTKICHHIPIRLEWNNKHQHMPVLVKVEQQLSRHSDFDQSGTTIMDTLCEDFHVYLEHNLLNIYCGEIFFKR